MLAALFDGRISLQFGVLAIPIGRGLLAGRSGYRKVTLALCCAALVIGVVLGVAAYFSMMGVRLTWVGDRRIVTVAVVFGYSVLTACIVGLRSAKMNAWFALAPSSRPDNSAWVLVLVFIGILTGSSDWFTAYHYESRMKELTGGMFSIDTEFRFFNTKTGKPLRSIGTSSSGTIGRSSDIVFSPQVSTEFTPVDGETVSMMVRLKGIAHKTYRITFIEEGFEDYVFDLDRRTPESVRIEMKELPKP